MSQNINILRDSQPAATKGITSFIFMISTCGLVKIQEFFKIFGTEKHASYFGILLKHLHV
jgi:hypothetical protein